MADEADALMAIRGSLETTDGIDLVKEAEDVGDLNSQASTLSHPWCTCPTHPTRLRAPHFLLKY